MKKKDLKKISSIIICIIAIILIGYKEYISEENIPDNLNTITTDIAIENIPEYENEIVININNDIPYFKDEEITTENFEEYSTLDELNRARVAFANICEYTMPPKGNKRESLSYKPTGWVQYLYGENNSKHLYERCHLIAWQLGNENNNKQNLITGTRYLNVEGMLPFENMVADYVKETDNHVLYRVTPIFERDNLLVSGVQMEAKSVEDNGDGISFNVYCYNVQPDIVIDYKTGESWEVGNEKSISESDTTTYILNTNTKKFHLKSCSSAKNLPEDCPPGR